MIVLKTIFWVSLAAARLDARRSIRSSRRCSPGSRRAAGAQGRDRRRPVAVIVAAYNEEPVIERRIENLLALDYPREPARDRRHLRRVDATAPRRSRADAGGARDPQPARRQGRGAGPRRARRPTARSSPSRTRTRRGRRTRCASSCARSPTRRSRTSAGGSGSSTPTARTRRASTGATSWRVRAAESPLGSVTGGNGSIYALRRADYVEVDPRFGHDLSLPYLMVQRGRRAVYEPEALAFEKPTPTNETEYRRKVRMFEHCWLIVLRGRMLRRLGPLYALEIVSHRLLRYACGSSTSSCSRPRSRSSPRAGSTTSCSRHSSLLARRSGRRRRASPATTCSSRGRPSSRSGTTSGAACPRRGSWRRGRAEPRARRRDRRGRARRHEPAARRRGARGQARGRRARPLPADARRQGRRRLRAAEAADDGRRRREAGRRVRGRQGRLADHEARAACCAGSASTSCRSSGTSSAATWP